MGLSEHLNELTREGLASALFDGESNARPLESIEEQDEFGFYDKSYISQDSVGEETLYKNNLPEVTKLQEGYLRDKPSKPQDKVSLYFNTKNYEGLEQSFNSPNYRVTFETNAGKQEFRQKFLKNVPEDSVNEMLDEIGKDTIKSSNLLGYKSRGYPIGISLQDNGFFPDSDEEFGVIIEVHNPKKSLVAYREDSEGNRQKCVIDRSKMKKEMSYEGRNYENAYVLRGKRKDLEGYLFASNIKSVHAVREPDSMKPVYN